MQYYFAQFDSEHELKAILKSTKMCIIVALAHSRSYLPEIRRDLESYYGIFYVDKQIDSSQFEIGFYRDICMDNYKSILNAIDVEIIKTFKDTDFPFYSMLVAVRMEFIATVREMRVKDLFFSGHNSVCNSQPKN